MVSKTLFASKKMDWETPQSLFDELDKEFGFELDVCAVKETAKCKRYYSPKTNGLLQEWGIRCCWMNPPYGREIINWMRKAYEQAILGSKVVCLVPARTDTKWWHEYAIKGTIRFIRGRLKFGNSKNSAPFPSAIVIFNPYLR